MECDESLGVDTAEGDAVLRMLKANVGLHVEPKFGMCFQSWAEADAFVRMFGARTVPFRLHNGGGKRSRVYVCKHPSRSIFCPRRMASNVDSDQGDTQKSEEIRGRGGQRGGSGQQVEESRLVQDIIRARERGLCHAVVQLQECSVRSIMRGSYSKTALTKWSYAVAKGVREDRSTRKGLRKFYSGFPKLDRLPEGGFAENDQVIAITEYLPHSCLEQGVFRDDSDKEDDEDDDEEENDGEENEDDDEDEGGNILEDGKSQPVRGLGRSLTKEQLALVLRSDFEIHERRWTMRDVRVEIKRYDPGAVALAGDVLALLRNAHELDMETEMELVQALAELLRERGFGVVLHTAEANSVREQVERGGIALAGPGSLSQCLTSES